MFKVNNSMSMGPILCFKVKLYQTNTNQFLWVTSKVVTNLHHNAVLQRRYLWF